MTSTSATAQRTEFELQLALFVYKTLNGGLSSQSIYHRPSTTSIVQRRYV